MTVVTVSSASDTVAVVSVLLVRLGDIFGQGHCKEAIVIAMLILILQDLWVHFPKKAVQKVTNFLYSHQLKKLLVVFLSINSTWILYNCDQIFSINQTH